MITIVIIATATVTAITTTFTNIAAPIVTTRLVTTLTIAIATTTTVTITVVTTTMKTNITITTVTIPDLWAISGVEPKRSPPVMTLAVRQDPLSRFAEISHPVVYANFNRHAVHRFGFTHPTHLNSVASSNYSTSTTTLKSYRNFKIH